MDMRHLRIIALIAALGMLAGGCRLLGGAASPAPGVEGTWLLSSGSVDGSPIALVAGSEPTMTLSGTDIGGRAGCNLYGGTFAIHGDRITISALSMTEMACDEDRMAEEAAYSAALDRVDTITLDGDRLVLAGSGVELRFTVVPPVADAELVGTPWLLQSLISADTATSVLGEPATMLLSADGQISGSTGCRTYAGAYARSGDTVTVTSLVVDDRACGDDLAGQDAHVLGVLDGSFSVTIDGNRLTIMAADGAGLDFAAELPD